LDVVAGIRHSCSPLDCPLKLQADCEFFNTVAALFDVGNLWKAAIDAKGFDCKHVPGRTGDNTVIGLVENEPGFGKSVRSHGTGMPE
jgi:hypothetical protein